MFLGWGSKQRLLWFAYTPNMTSGQHMQRPFNELICKHDDVICVVCRMDPFKASTELRGLSNVRTKNILLAQSHISTLKTCSSYHFQSLCIPGPTVHIWI